MSSAITNLLRALLVPGGLIVLVALVFLRPRVVPDAMLPFVRAYPYAVVAAGLFLGWFFHRSRIVFAIVVLALADRALLHFAPGVVVGAGAGRIVFNAVALLLPLNLAAYAAIPERGVLTKRGLVRLIPIPAQALALAWLCLPAQHQLAAWLEYHLVGALPAAWTTIPQPALAAFVLAMGIQVVRFLRSRSAMESGFLWALVAAFLALHGSRAGWAPTNFFSTAGLALIVALLETSYRMAYHDELTGLPGRRALNEALLRLGDRYAVAMVDVDHFKQFNDRYGHDVGDQVLRMVAAKLGAASGGGQAFRYGGEEFTVIFPGLSVDEALPHLEALRKAVESSRFALRGRGRPRKRPAKPKASGGTRRQVSVTISIGIAERDARRHDPEQVIMAADKALYRAKDGGRNRVSV